MVDSVKISITLANYNHARYLDSYFEGILSQSYPFWELVVTDDGSTDDSLSILKQYAEKDSRIKLFVFPENKGSLPAFFNCYMRCDGELLFATASDDYLSNSIFFEEAVRAFQRYPQLGVFFAKEEILDAGDEDFLCLSGFAPKSGYLSSKESMESFLRKKLLIPGCCSILRRKCADDLGGYPSDLGAYCDYYLNHAVAARHGSYFWEKVSTRARVDLKQKSNLSLQMTFEQRLSNIYKIYSSYQNKGLFDSNEICISTIKQWLMREIKDAVSSNYQHIWSLRTIWFECKKMLPGGESHHPDVEAIAYATFAQVENEILRVSMRLSEVLGRFREKISASIPMDVIYEVSGAESIYQFMFDGESIRHKIRHTLLEKRVQIETFDKVFIYGMGNHTKVLLDEWHFLELPKISAITCSEIRNTATFEGYPTVKPQDLIFDSQLVVFSSMAYEKAMIAHLSGCVLNFTGLCFWDRSLSDL